MAIAVQEHRVLLTEDKDFGWLAFVARAASQGVVLIRFPSDSRDALSAAILDLAAKHGAQLAGSFTVLQPGHARLTPKPGP